ncbi:MAG: hypothetical protein NTV49_14700, partial [Kiritimatiellaeota bacterium]|nr:hypothetical protein [Kiritimatiellota bacterium]
MDSTDTRDGVERMSLPGQPVDLGALVGAARGLGWLSGSLLLTVLLLMGAVEIRLLNLFPAPAFLLGTALGWFGLARLRPADGLTPLGWRHRRRARNLVLLQVYFAPFVGWWQAAPANLFFFVNLLLFLLSLAGLLLLISRLAGDLGVALADASVVSEARLCRLVTQLLVTPSILAAGLLGMALRADVLMPSASLSAMLPESDLPPWLYTALLAGVLMTMIVCWKGAQACYRLLTRSAPPPPGAAGACARPSRPAARPRPGWKRSGTHGAAPEIPDRVAPAARLR